MRREVATEVHKCESYDCGTKSIMQSVYPGAEVSEKESQYIHISIIQLNVWEYSVSGKLFFHMFIMFN